MEYILSSVTRPESEQVLHLLFVVLGADRLSVAEMRILGGGVIK